MGEEGEEQSGRRGREWERGAEEGGGGTVEGIVRRRKGGKREFRGRRGESDVEEEDSHGVDAVLGPSQVHQGEGALDGAAAGGRHAEIVPLHVYLEDRVAARRRVVDSSRCGRRECWKGRGAEEPAHLRSTAR